MEIVVVGAESSHENVGNWLLSPSGKPIDAPAHFDRVRNRGRQPQVIVVVFDCAGVVVLGLQDGSKNVLSAVESVAEVHFDGLPGACLSAIEVALALTDLGAVQ